jgi:hypothetical protein
MHQSKTYSLPVETIEEIAALVPVYGSLSKVIVSALAALQMQSAQGRVDTHAGQVERDYGFVGLADAIERAKPKKGKGKNGKTVDIHSGRSGDGNRKPAKHYDKPTIARDNHVAVGSSELGGDVIPQDACLVCGGPRYTSKEIVSGYKFNVANDDGTFTHSLCKENA